MVSPMNVDEMVTSVFVPICMGTFLLEGCLLWDVSLFLISAGSQGG